MIVHAIRTRTSAGRVHHLSIAWLLYSEGGGRTTFLKQQIP